MKKQLKRGQFMEKTLKLIENIGKRTVICTCALIVCILLVFVFYILLRTIENKKTDIIFAILAFTSLAGVIVCFVLLNKPLKTFAYISDIISGEEAQEKYEAILEEYPDTIIINVSDEDSVDEESLSFGFFIDKKGNTYIRKDYETIESVEYQNRIENAKEILE